MIRTLQLERGQLKYDLAYKNIKNINLRIKTDGSVMVSAPLYADITKIDKFVLSKCDYIFNSIEKFKEIQMFKPKEKRYISGESFKYLGKDLQLKVISYQTDEVFIDGKYLYLKTKNKDDYYRKKRLIDNWKKSQTKLVYEEIAKDVYRNFEKYGIDYPILCMRQMKKRWGSCQPHTNVITINSRLIEAPRFCIEYVMMHEFCHFIHPNHSKDFYTLLQVMMPDWKERKKFLEQKVYM